MQLARPRCRQVLLSVFLRLLAPIFILLYGILNLLLGTLFNLLGLLRLLGLTGSARRGARGRTRKPATSQGRHTGDDRQYVFHCVILKQVVPSTCDKFNVLGSKSNY